jgi:hypothetical protein
MINRRVEGLIPRMCFTSSIEVGCVVLNLSFSSWDIGRLSKSKSAGIFNAFDF